MRLSLIFIITTFIFSSAMCQEMRNIEHLYGGIGNDLFTHDNEDNTYILHTVYNKIDIQHNLFDSVECGIPSCNFYILAKYNKENKLIKSIKFSIDSVLNEDISFNKLKFLNNSIFLIGGTNTNVKVNEKLIDLPYHLNSRGFSFVFKLDVELNLTQIEHFNEYSYLNDISFGNKKYYLAGYFMDSILQFQNYQYERENFTKIFILDQSGFLLELDENFSKVTNAIFPEGDGYFDINSLNINSKGDIIISGITGVSAFTFKDEEVIVNNFIFQDQSYLMSLDKNFKLNFFKDLNTSDEVKVIIDDQDNIYTYFGGNKISFDGIEFYNSNIYCRFLASFDEKGEMRWYKLATLKADKSNLDLYNFQIEEAKLLMQVRHSQEIKMDDYTFMPTNNSKNWCSGAMALDKDSGKFISMHYVDPLVPTRLDGMYVKKNGDLFFLYDLYNDAGAPILTNLANPIIWEGEKMYATFHLIDFRRGPISDIKDEINLEEISILPSVLQGTDFMLLSGLDHNVTYNFEVQDIAGKKQDIDFNQNSLACLSCGSGMYFLKIITRRKIITKKFIHL